MRRPRACALLAACCALASACTRSTLTLHGAGGTSPGALFAKWDSEFARAPAGPAQILYSPAGPESGLRQLNERAADFGSSSSPMTDEQLARATGRPVHIPVSLGAVAVAYHLPGFGSGRLRLAPAALADIYRGRIASWDDPRLASLNPGAGLPALPITAVPCSDESGTGAVLLEYLAKSGPGAPWPAGAPAEGSDAATARRITSTPGALGCLELAEASRAGLPTASLRNEAGEFVAPSLEGIAAAAEGAARLIPADLRAFLVDAPGAQAYPLSFFFYVLADRDNPQPARAAELARFLWWAVHDGQRFAPGLHRAALPPAVVARTEARLRSLQSASAPLTLLTAPPL